MRKSITNRVVLHLAEQMACVIQGRLLGEPNPPFSKKGRQKRLFQKKASKTPFSKKGRQKRLIPFYI